MIAAGGYPAAEAERAAGPRAAGRRSCRPGVDVERFRPLDAERAGQARRALRPARPTAALVVERQPARAPQGLRRADRGRGAGWRPTAPTSSSPSPAAAATERRLERLAARTGAPVRLPRPGARRRPARACTAAPTCSPCCAATGGAGLEQEGFGIVFLEAAACGVPRWRATAAARPRRSPTARPGSWSTARATPRRWPARWRALLDDPDRRRARWAPPARRAGRGRVRLRRAGRPAGRRCWPVVTAGTDRPTTPVADRARSTRASAVPPSVAADEGPARRSCVRRVGDGRVRGGRRSRPRSCPTPCEYVAVPVDLVLFVVGCVGVPVGLRRGDRPQPLRGDLTMAGCSSSGGTVAPARVAARAAGCCWPSRSSWRSATAAARPFTALAFGVLVPMLGLGLMALWGARYGALPGRRGDARRRRADGRSAARGGPCAGALTCAASVRDTSGGRRDG